MLKSKKTDFTIQYPEEVLSMEKHVLDTLKEMFDNKDLIFLIPTELLNNDLKVIYKVGFLKKIYKNIYPDMSYVNIYKLINTRWQVFKSERQMERYASKYVKLFEEKRGI